MSWSGEKNAGFSSADHTWLPIHPNYRKHNIEVCVVKLIDNSMKKHYLFFNNHSDEVTVVC